MLMSKVTYSNSYIHYNLLVVAALQGANLHIKSSFGVQYLAKGYFDMQTRGIKPATFWQQEAGSTSKPQPPYYCDDYCSNTELFNTHFNNT